MSDEYELRLLGARVPSGEIRLRDLAGIAESLQELSLRIGRAAVGAEGAGRTHQLIEELSQLRLRGIEAGSTSLLISRGAVEDLGIELDPVTELDDRFWDIIGAVCADNRPAGVPDGVAETAARFVVAVQNAAPEIVISRKGGDRVHIRTVNLHRETWTVARRSPGEHTTVSGRLEKVDLHSHDYRVRDDVGNSIELKKVPEDPLIGDLVGKRIRVQGLAEVDKTGRVVALTEPSLERDSEPLTAARVPAEISLDVILSSVPGPDPDGGIELSDEEFAAYREAIGL